MRELGAYGPNDTAPFHTIYDSGPETDFGSCNGKLLHIRSIPRSLLHRFDSNHGDRQCQGLLLDFTMLPPNAERGQFEGLIVMADHGRKRSC